MKHTPLSFFTWSDHSVGMLAFLVLFPGFFFYHTLLGLGLMSAVLGGYFAPVSLMVVGPLAFLYVFRVRRTPSQLTRTDVFFLLYIAYFLTVIAINALAGANAKIVSNHILGVMFILNMFFIFRLTDCGRRDFRLASIVSLIGMSAIVFSYSVEGSFYLATLGTAKNPESLATYQGFSRSYLVTFTVAIAFCRALPLRIFLYCLAAPTLFINTARSEFVAMLFLVPIIELYFSRHKFILTALFAALCLLVYLNLEQLLSALPSNRILELVDLSHSSSATKRHHLTMYAMNTIGKFPLFGDYASYSPGFYSHNVLSAWVDTGLFGFLFVLALLVLPLCQMILKGFPDKQRSGQFLLAFTLAASTLLLLASSHYFTDMLIGATLGAYSSYRYGRKNAKHRPPDVSAPAPRYPDLHQAMP